MTHIFKTTLAGNGAAYTWQELDEKGELVRQSEQLFPSEADAEKAIRTLAKSDDIIEVETIKNVNVDGNRNVNLVRPEVLRDQANGMNVVAKSVVASPEDEEALPEAKQEHANVAKMAKLEVPEPKKVDVKAKAEAKAKADKKAAAKAKAIAKAKKASEDKDEDY